jgi:hypothetical protein
VRNEQENQNVPENLIVTNFQIYLIAPGPPNGTKNGITVQRWQRWLEVRGHFLLKLPKAHYCLHPFTRVEASHDA